MSDPASAPLPKTIGPYRVVRAIARGGMASVYEVEDPGTGQKLALKLLTQRGAAGPRFNREYRALTRLDHPHIVRVYRYGITEDRRPYLTMELLDGVPAQVHAKGCGRPGTPRRTSQVIRVIKAVAEALDHLHERGIVHRDLKSSNVMVLKDGRIKLLDFGTVRALEQDDEITRHGEFVGTFAYASPEQLAGDVVGPRSDIYSLGVLFYRLLSGKRPFETDDPGEMARLHAEHVPRPPGDFVAGVAPSVSDLVMRMLAKDPGDRPGRASEVAESLEGLGDDGETALDDPSTLSAADVIGRDAEVKALRAIFGRAKPGRMVLVTGPPGSGRGRLLTQAAHDAAQLGWRALEARFPGGPGLGGLAEAVRTAARGLPLGEEADLAALSQVPGEGELDPLALARVMSAVLAVLQRRVEQDGRPVVILLRELDQAPPLALQTLRLVRAKAIELELPVVILAGAADDADTAGSALRLAFPDASRLPLGPLDPSDIGRLVGALLGRTNPPPALARRIHEATGGMPGYVVEVVHAMVRQGLVEARRSADERVSWVDRSAGQIAIPSSLTELLGNLVEDLPDDTLSFVEALAVVGGEADTRTLLRATGLDLPRGREVVQDLLRQRLITCRTGPGGEEVVFRLGMSVQIIRERLGAGRRMQLQRALADALPAGEPSPERVRVLLAAGHLARSVEEATAWAAARMAQGELAQVVPLLERVVQRVEGSPDAARGVEPGSEEDEPRARLLLLLARALGLTEAADVRAHRLLSRARSLARGRVLAEVDLERAAVFTRQGQQEAALDLLLEVAERPEVKADLLLSATVLLARGKLGLLRGDPDVAEGMYAALVDHGFAPAVEAAARVGLGLAAHARGELVLAEEELGRGRAAYAEVDHTPGIWHAALNLAEVLRLQGRFTEALAQAEPHLDLARQGGSPVGHAGLLVNIAETRIELFQLGEVRDLLAEADSIELCRANPYLAAAFALVRGRLLLACDDPAGAVAVLEPATIGAERSGLVALSATLRAWWGEAAGQSGQAAEADLLTLEAVTALRRFTHVPHLAEAITCRARALGGQVDPAEVFAPVRGWLETRPARLIRVEWYLALAGHAVRRRELARARAGYQSAAQVLDEIGERLHDGDRAALRVHPWRRRVERGMLLLG